MRRAGDEAAADITVGNGEYLRERFLERWRNTADEFPEFNHVYAVAGQRQHERELDLTIEKGFKQVLPLCSGGDPEEIHAREIKSITLSSMSRFVHWFRLPLVMSFLESYYQSALHFVRRAKQFDPNLSSNEIYQAEITPLF